MVRIVLAFVLRETMVAPNVAYAPPAVLFSEEAKQRWRCRASQDRPVRTAWTLFAGGGGDATGTAWAIREQGEEILMGALNHNPWAVATHASNHADMFHVCHPVDGVTPSALVPGGHLDLLTLSPSCKPFSTNVNGRPVDPEERALCWHVLPWLSMVDVDYMILENVPGFAKLGPLYPKGHPDEFHPIPERAGEEFEAFVLSVRSKGYEVQWRILDCADYGVPQNRVRFILLAAKDGLPIRWPARTHGDGSSLYPFRTARDVVDLSNKGLPIHHPKKAGRLSPYMLARIADGIEEFGWGTPFLVPRQQGKNTFVRSLDRPLMTIIASDPGVSLIQTEGRTIYHRRLTLREYLRAQSFPADYVLRAPRKRAKEALIGNAVPPLMMKRLVSALLYGEQAEDCAIGLDALSSLR